MIVNHMQGMGAREWWGAGLRLVSGAPALSPSVNGENLLPQRPPKKTSRKPKSIPSPLAQTQNLIRPKRCYWGHHDDPNRSLHPPFNFYDSSYWIRIIH